MVRVATALLAVLTLVFAARVQAGSGVVTSVSGALKELNAERQANGIPGTLTEVKYWSTACAAHNRYMTANNYFNHPEAKGTPGYSDLGNWAGTNAVLSLHKPWLTNANPFETAPIHLIQMLAPQLTKVGIAFDSTHICMTTWPGYDDSAVPRRRMYTFPGDGARNVPPTETASELPAVPQQFVGIPAGRATGPHLFVYGTGFGLAGYHAHITKAQLLDPFGRPVAIRTVDRSNQAIGNDLPPGSGMIIPVSPLLEGAPYEASVTIASTEGSTSYTWTFETAGKHVVHGKPVIKMHPPHSVKVELANTSSTLSTDISPVPLPLAPVTSKASDKPTVTVSASVASQAAFTFTVTIPHREDPFDLVLVAGGKQVGTLAGVRFGSSLDTAPISTLFPRLAPRTIGYRWSLSLKSSTLDASGRETVTITADGGVLDPGTYLLLVRQAKKTGSATFSVRP